MSTTSLELAAGQSVSHAEMGDGVVVAIELGGYARVFFRAHGAADYRLLITDY